MDPSLVKWLYTAQQSCGNYRSLPLLPQDAQPNTVTLGRRYRWVERDVCYVRNVCYQTKLFGDIKRYQYTGSHKYPNCHRQLSSNRIDSSRLHTGRTGTTLGDCSWVSLIVPELDITNIDLQIGPVEPPPFTTTRIPTAAVTLPPSPPPLYPSFYAPSPKDVLPDLKFPKGFVFGLDTAAYQVEGAAKNEGKGPTMWDWASRQPNGVTDNTTGEYV